MAERLTLTGQIARALVGVASVCIEVARGAGGLSYVAYLAHFRSCHGNDAKPLSRREFAASELERRYRGISRCC